MTRQGMGILPLQNVLLSYVVTSLVATEYGVNDTWQNCPNLPRHGVAWYSTRCSSKMCVRAHACVGLRGENSILMPNYFIYINNFYYIPYCAVTNTKLVIRLTINIDNNYL